MSRYSKAIVAVLTAVVAIGTQLLGMGVLPAEVARWVTIGVAVIGAALVYRVPNTQPPAVGDELSQVPPEEESP